MHKWVSALGVAVAMLFAACGGDESTTGTTNTTSPTTSSSSTSGSGGSTGGSGGSATGGSGGAAAMVPTPPDTPANEWNDVEPNNTPGEAVPVGVLSGAFWMGFSMPLTAINPDDDVDFYVFKTGTSVNVFIDLAVCFSFSGNLLDLFLYEVVNGFQGPLVASSTDTTGACETLLTTAEATATLQANTTYLLEVRAGPGLMLNGDPGLYDA